MRPVARVLPVVLNVTSSCGGRVGRTLPPHCLENKRRLLTAWCTAERLGLTPLGEQFADSVRSAYGHVLTTDTDFAGRQFDWLRRGQLDLLAMRLPLAEPAGA